jgi:hypothetical protein
LIHKTLHRPDWIASSSKLTKVRDSYSISEQKSSPMEDWFRKLSKRTKPNQNDGQKKKPKRKLLIHKTLHRPDWATRIPLKYEGELRYSGGISKYCSTSGIHHVSYSCYKPGDTSRMRKGLMS